METHDFRVCISSFAVQSVNEKSTSYRKLVTIIKVSLNRLVPHPLSEYLLIKQYNFLYERKSWRGE